MKYTNTPATLRVKSITKNNLPLISIITATYNCDRTLEQTIISVINQNYKNIELIIIDGASTDDTINIIKRYEEHIKYWISESDNGIFDAMNKGINAVTDLNSYILFLNADDYLYENTTIERVVSEIDDEDFIYGKVQSIGEYTSVYLGKQLTLNELPKSMVQHQATFVKRKLFNDLGVFDISFKIAADFEFAVRVMKSKFKYKFINVVVAVMRMGGASSKNYKTTFREKSRIIINQYKGFSRINALLFYNFYEIPKHSFSILLNKLGLLNIWRRWKKLI